MPIEILMPALSPTMTEGNLTKWEVKEGDKVNSGDVVCEIETDKATMEVEAADEGTVGKILIPAGTEGVAVNTPIALLLEDGEDASALKGYKPSTAPAAAPTAAPLPEAGDTASAPVGHTPTAPVVQAAVPTATINAGRTIASPLARRIASQRGVNLASVQGSGPRGRIVKRDVESAQPGQMPAPAAGSAATTMAPPPPMEGVRFTDVPNNAMRKTIARRLQESKQTVPHFYLTVDCKIDNLLDMRKRLNDAAPMNGDKPQYKISVNDIIIKAVALALKNVPTANVSWFGDFIRQYQSVDISVAVATEGGLITPVIRDADAKGIAEVSAEVKALAGRAREGKLMPEEYTGGGFTISNLGMYGTREFAAIINPPQSCILAVGAGEPRPVVKNGALAIATVMSCTLSADHRAVDGAVGAEFMAEFKRIIEEPMTLAL